jgi:predicted transcriptional regulator
MASLTIHQIASAARGRRQLLGLSQGQVADRLGVSRRWVRDFEAGNGGAHLETVLRLIDMLGIDLAFAGEQQPADEDTGILDAIIEEHRSPLS